MQALRNRIEKKSSPEPNSGCWLWLGSVRGAGYGCISICNRTVAAHRAAWIAYRGCIPNGAFVCHRCDNRSCVNPDHLFLADHAGNMADMKMKARAHRPIGELQARHKLTSSQVAAILAEPAPIKRSRAAQIAEMFGISRTYIWDIRRGVSWNHVSGKPKVRDQGPLFDHNDREGR